MAKQNTPELTQQIVDATRKAMRTDVPSQEKVIKINEKGVTPTISSTFDRNDQEYIDSRVNIKDEIISPPVVYGEVWLDINTANKVLVRSDTDPGRILARYVFPMADGENGGVSGATDLLRLSNVVINGVSLIDRLTGLANFGDVTFKESPADGVTSIWDSVTNFLGIGESDPSTGETISSLEKKKATNPKFEELLDVDHTAKCNYAIPYWNESTRKWETKHINNLIIEVNPTLEKTS